MNPGVESIPSDGRSLLQCLFTLTGSTEIHTQTVKNTVFLAHLHTLMHAHPPMYMYTKKGVGCLVNE